MHVNILILIVYTSNYQSNTILYENMRNDFAKSFLILFSYSFYLFYSFLMHYGCIFSQTLVELYDYSFFLCRLLSNFLLFTAFLCIMHLISLCFSLIITIFSYYYLYRCTRVNRSFHSSGRFFLL